MSVKSEQQINQSKAIELPELNERERMVVQMFRLLDQESQQDIIRFLDVLLTGK
jgi:DNA-directed RNA polymerase specialized sigma subunit